MKNRRLGDEDAVQFEVNDKIPHRDEMRLIDGIAFKDKNKVTLSIIVPSDSIFVAPDKVVAPLAMIEMLAQLCSAQYTFEEGLDHDGHLCGYLVGIDNVKFTEPVYAGDKLDLIAWNVIELKEVHRILGEVFRDDIIVGQAELTLYKTEEWISQPEIADHQKGLVNVLSKEYSLWASERDTVSKEIVQSISNIDVKHEESVEATICFQPDFVGFSGHFPGYPVLPGIVIIYAGWLLAEMCANKKLDLYFIKKAKFIRPIHPLDTVDVILKHIKNDNEQLIWHSVKIKCQGDLMAKYEIGTNLV